MPANLNALIRYKTINSALHGGNRRWSIPELTEKCSSALAEYRGIYKKVSERTIRDDIRVMRSDILGYNAPISLHKGLYYYADPKYSIMTISFTDSALVERIILFLREIKPKVAHPELEIILEKLNALKIDNFDKPAPATVSRKKIVTLREELCEMATEPHIPWNPDLLTWADLYLYLQ